ncbi:hypothetical protein [Sulfurihydrogenibium sp. YO3AOP1]|nr:hypothetical protein [Sulfurihydrogenibium sp. YO3AOP1]
MLLASSEEKAEEILREKVYLKHLMAVLSVIFDFLDFPKLL